MIKTSIMIGLFVSVLVFLAGIGRAQWLNLVFKSITSAVGVSLTIIGAHWLIKVLVEPPDMSEDSSSVELKNEPDLSPLKEALQSEQEGMSESEGDQEEEVQGEEGSQSGEEAVAEPSSGNQTDEGSDQGAEELAGLISDTIDEEP